MRIAFAADTVETASAFQEMLDRLTSSPPGQAFFAEPHDRVRKELDEGGWLDASTGPDGLIDAVALAEVWGRYLYPLPFLEALMLRRWLGEESPSIDAAPRLAIGPASAALVPFGEPADGVGPSALMLAPSLPLTAGTGISPLAPDQQRELASVYAATTVGCASAALVRVAEYAAQREAFGRPIITFQSLRHRVANIMRDVELARTAAAWSAADDADDWQVAALKCVDLSRAALEGAGQVFGGISFTWEFGLHYYSRHVLAVRRALRAIGAAQPDGEEATSSGTGAP